MTDAGRRIVALDLVVALSNVAVGASTTTAVTVGPAAWWAAPVTAVVAALLAAASDRSRAGLWTLVAVGSLGVLAVAWATLADAGAPGVLPPALVGLGVGLGLNRVAFGVVREVPAVRRRRQRS